VPTLHACILKEYAKVACWGAGGNGRLGGLRNLHEPNPVEVPYVEGVVDIQSKRNRTCAVQSSGQVICWGVAEYQQLSTEVTEKLPVTSIEEINEDPNKLLRENSSRWGPVVIPGVTAKQLSMGLRTTCAVQLDATVTCWQPAEDFGREFMAPFTVNGLHSIEQVAVGNQTACAMTQNGEVYCWELTPSGMQTPTILNGLSKVSALTMGSNHACAIVEDGILMCWGRNGSGELGIGSEEKRFDQPQRVKGFRN